MKPLHIHTYTDPQKGLEEGQIGQQIRNRIESRASKSYKSIFLEHTFTFFNVVNFILAALVAYTGSLRNMLFLIVVFANILIGLIQEIRAKKVLDTLAFLNQPKIQVLRDGKTRTIDIDKIVQNDIVILQAGDQVPCDGVIINGTAQVDESSLSGESESVDKTVGDSLYSGCYLQAGYCRMQAAEVGESTYISQVMKTARRNKPYPSQLRDSLQRLIRYCTGFLVPAGILLFAKVYWGSHQPLNAAVLSSVSAMVGMIPEGLVILTSVALALASVKLARQKVLVQELYCTETLARVSVLCLDKTGTLTTGNMNVSQVLPQEGYTLEQIRQVLANLYGSLKDDNVTAKAIRRYVHNTEAQSFADTVFPFSSSAKCAGGVWNQETWLIGAYTFILKNPDSQKEKEIETLASKGLRILALVKAPKMSALAKTDGQLAALIVLEDELRPDAAEIMKYFKEQDVQIKIISGDMPATVGAIAAKAGVTGKVLDMSLPLEANLETVMEEYTVFGRVSPDQKRDMVRALQKSGQTVAMTGDGVNDVMALKEADCSIAMGSGTQAARSIASIVLLEDQFEALPSILNEGRRVINNIERTASLFLVKTIYSFGLTLLTLFWLARYPFEPVQLTLVSGLFVGIPSFILTLEPNYSRVQGNFLVKVLSNAMPGALGVITGVIAVQLFSMAFFMDPVAFSSMCTWIAGFNGLWVLYSVCQPFTRIRMALLISMACLFAAAVIGVPQLFNMCRLGVWQYVFCWCLAIALPFYHKALKKVPWKDYLQRWLLPFKKSK